MAVRFGVFMLIILTNASALRYYVVSPNVFRLNVEETVSIQVFKAMEVELSLQDPARPAIIISPMVTFCEPNVPKIVKMKITEADLPKSSQKKVIHFNLVAKGNGFEKKSPVLLDIKSGTIFIQTDKPIYSPDEKIVKYRVIPVGIDLLPLQEKVMIEIKNPNGIRVRREQNIVAWKRGFVSKEFTFGELAVLGKWTITAFFGYKNKLKSSTTFVLKKYVLPKFSVRISPIHFVTHSLAKYTVMVTAMYSFGKEVRGTARMNLFIEENNGKNHFLHKMTKKIKGKIEFIINWQEIPVPEGITSFPVGKHMKVVVEVIEDATGIKESAKIVSVPIVERPFRISLEKTVRYFKPSLPVIIRAVVRYPDGSPVIGEKLIIEAKDGKISIMDKHALNWATTNEDGEVSFSIHTPNTVNSATRIQIKVRTNNDLVEDSDAETILEPYRSKERNYISIRIPNNRPKVGSQASVSFVIPNNDAVDQLNYMVLSRGKIIVSHALNRKIGAETSVSLRITADMVPKCRLIAFFVRNGEMASDSVMMDVVPDYKNKVELETDPDPSMVYMPGGKVDVRLKTTRKSIVGLLAVDKSIYYLRNESRVTNKRVFNSIGKFDMGCGFGSGADNKHVFENVGLSMMSDVPFTITKRHDVTCPETKARRRRSLENKSSDLLKDCCKGNCCNKTAIASAMAASMKMVCKDMETVIQLNCWKDFYSCCNEKLQGKGRSSKNEDGTSDPDDIPETDDGSMLRILFPENWIWIDLRTRDDGNLRETFILPDSITKWEITALAMSHEAGFGLSNPIDITSRMKMFIDVKMPYSVKRYEQVTIQAVVHNLSHRKLRVNLFLNGSSSFCSVAEPGRKSKLFSHWVRSMDVFSFPFTITPLKIGKTPIMFIAHTVDGRDRISKELLVVPEGVAETETSSLLLDPQGTQNMKIDMNIRNRYVQGSMKAIVYITGNLMNVGIKEFTETGFRDLILLPNGCGEQTMVKLAPILYIFQYLEQKGISKDVEETAYEYMRKGYNSELYWRRDDNSYSTWGKNTSPSTWLSAFVNKVFCQATKYIADDIDNEIICKTVRFLESVQTPGGYFSEDYKVINRNDHNGERIWLTAYVTISLIQCKSQCPDSNSRIVSKATKYLEDRIEHQLSGYEMSLVAYALVLANSPKKIAAYNELLRFVKKRDINGRTVGYIRESKLARQIEATAYTVLVMLQYNRMADAALLVHWLIRMRNAKGSFSSTQDTVVGLEALSAYGLKISKRPLDLNIMIKNKRKSFSKSFKLSKENAFVRMEADITNLVPGTLHITAVGRGTAQFQVEMKYNRRLKPGAKSNCDFKLKVKTNTTAKIVTIEVCASRNAANESGMTIAEVGLLSGFKADENSLKTLLVGSNPRVNHYEVSDRNVVFYLENISSRKSCFKFATKQVFQVGSLQEVPVKVYDYYEPDGKCIIFYRTESGRKLAKPICTGSACSCSQATKPVSLTGNIAIRKPTAQSSTQFDGVASRGNDGNSSPNWNGWSCTHTKKQRNPWWRVDLINSYLVSQVKITNRRDCCWNRLKAVEVDVGFRAAGPAGNQRCAYYPGAFGRGETKTLKCRRPIRGKYVFVTLKTTEILTLCEVEVFAVKGWIRPILHTLIRRNRCMNKSEMNVEHLRKFVCSQKLIVFLGEVINIQEKQRYQEIVFNVKNVYITGTKNSVHGRKIIVFKFGNCPKPHLRMNKKYLVILQTGMQFFYSLKSDAFIWPKNESKTFIKFVKRARKGRFCNGF